MLSAGEGALLAGVSACQAYGVFKMRTGTVHVVRRGAAARRRRLHIHSMPDLPPRRMRNGIPLVPIEEALLGLAADATIPDHDGPPRHPPGAGRQAHAPSRAARLREDVDGRPGVGRLRLLVGDLIIEVDSERFHDNPIAAADDACKRAPDRRVERLTWDDVHVTPVRTARRLRRRSVTRTTR